MQSALPTPDICEPAGARDAFDPRWLLAGTGMAIAALLTLRQPSTAVVGLTLAVFLAFALAIPPRWLLGRLALVAPVLALFVLPLPFLLTGPGDEFGWGPLVVSYHGCRVATLLAAKALTITTLALVTLRASSFTALLMAAHALRVPGVLVQLGLLAYRYLFVLADELTHLRIALRVRGYRNRPSRHCYRTIGHVAGMLLVRGHDRAERVAQAMRCRGFDGRFRALAEFRTRPRDVALWAGMVGAAAALVVFDRMLA